MSDQDNLDTGAFETLFRSHYPVCVRVAQGILNDRSAAEDVAQEVMLELWRRRGHVPPDIPIRAYLIRAARNRALNHLRHERVVQRTAPHAPKPSPSPAADHGLGEHELSEAVRRAVGDLPDRCREVFELSRVSGLTYGEIAATLEISIKTVEAQMGKALRLLRERLAQWLPPGTT